MPIQFSCTTCAKKYSVKSALAGRKARCACGAVNAIPAAVPDADFVSLDLAEVSTLAVPEPRRAASSSGASKVSSSSDRAAKAPVEAEPEPAFGGMFDFSDNEPVHRLPEAVERKLDSQFVIPAAPKAALFGNRGGDASPSTTGKRKPSPRKPVNPSASGGGGSSNGIKALAGGIFTILCIVGWIARGYRAVDRATRDDNKTSSSLVSSKSAAAPAGPLTTAAPAPVRPIQAPPRVEPTSHGAYAEARMSVINSAGYQTRLAVMLPAGKHAAGSLPCVFVAPAGTPLIWGNDLEESYTSESMPYVRAGFAVVRYSLTGAMQGEPENASNQMVANCYGQFRAAHAGYADASAAIDIVLADYPEIDAARLFTAGHSSAGNVAMLAAQKDPRIKACVAYAPAIDVRARLADGFNELATLCPGLDDFVRTSSPNEYGAPRCPVMLFHAEDDANVPVSPNRSYSARHGNMVKFVTTRSGGHYDSMISAGIPAGIKFLIEDQKALPKKS